MPSDRGHAGAAADGGAHGELHPGVSAAGSVRRGGRCRRCWKGWQVVVLVLDKSTRTLCPLLMEQNEFEA